MYNYNILFKLNLPDNKDGILDITDGGTCSFRINPGNQINLQKGTISYKAGDILQVSYDNLVITTNLIDYTTNIIYYTYTNNITTNGFSPVRIIISCKGGTSTSGYTFSGIKFYTTGEIPKTDCKYTDWITGMFSSCNTSNTSLIQTRSILTPEMGGGSPCTDDLTHTVPCESLLLLLTISGTPTIQNNTTATLYTGSQIGSTYAYNMYNYNILLRLKLPDNNNGVFVITDTSTFSFTLNPINQITLNSGTIRSYNTGDILRVSYDNLVVTTNLINSTTNIIYYTYTNNIFSINYGLIRLRIACTNTTTAGCTFTDINFYTIGELPKTDCVLTDWVNNGSCSLGLQKQTRTIKSLALNGGISCSTLLLTEPLSRTITC